MKLLKTFASLVLVYCCFYSVHAQDKLGHLRSWAGKYPTYKGSRPRRQFLKLPEIHGRLLKLVSPKDYRFIMDVCGKEVPIEQMGDYLIVRKCHRNYCLRGTALIIVNLKDGSMYIALRDENDSEARWLSSGGDYRALPFEVKSGWTITRSRS
ncbi:MAG TPA: hypothetical protein VF708_03270 [Pyrinomonadaceae bacterium]|jgi:hypothetical protein